MRLKADYGMFCAGWHRLTSLLPSSCDICNKPAQDAICRTCRQKLVDDAPCRCIQCGERFPCEQPSRNQRCGNCLTSGYAFDRTHCALSYAWPQNGLVLALKFSTHLHLCHTLGQIMWESLKATDIETPDCLIPIPLGLKRLQMRGYNQSLELARSIHSLSDVPLHHKVLRREKETLAQSNLSRQERRRNLRGAFMVDPKQAGHIDGRHVALIDDVMTTGETLHAAAKVLKAHGARTITNLVFARTDLT